MVRALAVSDEVEPWGLLTATAQPDRATVARRWYSEEFQPVVRMLRDAGLVGDRTDAEAYLHLAAQRYRLMRTHRWDENVVDRLRADSLEG